MYQGVAWGADESNAAASAKTKVVQMANSWLRLWHDMPTDPKWRTIARKSKQRIGDVIAVYLHLLVNASSNSETHGNAGVTQGNSDKRGVTKNLCADDIASSLDMDFEQVEQILSAMQGKVLDGERLTGWTKRQPKREDDSAPRVKAFRDKKRAAQEAAKNEKTEGETHGNAGVTQGNAGVTQGNAPDKDPDKDLKDKTLLSHGEKNAKRPEGNVQESDPADQNPDDPEAGGRKNRHEYPPDFETAWLAYPRRPGSPDKHGALKAWNARLREGVTSESMLDGTRRYAAFVVATGKSGTEFIKQAKTFLGPSRHFEDEWKITTEVTQHAEFRLNQNDQRSYYEQFMEWERQTGQSTAGMATVGTDDQNLRPTLDCEEWQSTIGPMDGPGQFDDE